MRRILALALLFLPETSPAQSPVVKLLVDNGRYKESEWVRQLAVTSDDKYLIVHDFSSGLRIYEIETGKLLNLFEGHALEGDLYFNAKTNMLVTTGDKKIKIWDISRQSLAKEIRQAFHSQFMNDVYIDSKKKFVFAQKVKYDFATGKQLKTYTYPRMYFYEDKYYLFNAANGKVSQYDVFTDQLLKTYTIDPYKKGINISFNENKGYLFIGYVDGVLAVDIVSGKVGSIFFNREYNFDNLSICANFDFSSDHKFFVATSHQGKDNRIWKKPTR
jgi:WD40 repeat protein